MIERDKEYYNQKISELYTIIENQEKIIRDLQERNKSTYYITDDEYIKITESHCSNLQQRIDKAIEYIENGDLLYLASKCSVVYRDNIEVVSIYDRLKDLLEILKGGNND